MQPDLFLPACPGRRCRCRRWPCAPRLQCVGTARPPPVRPSTLGSSHSAIEVVPLALATAFAVPGRPGHIVVSKGTLDCLDVDERRAMFAHERAHLDHHHHHHRYVHLARLAAAAVPIVRPLVQQVRFATERWADEVAAAEVGDRHVVTSAIARAALARHDGVRPPAVALSGEGDVARVEALLQPAARGVSRDDVDGSWVRRRARRRRERGDPTPSLHRLRASRVPPLAPVSSGRGSGKTRGGSERDGISEGHEDRVDRVAQIPPEPRTGEHVVGEPEVEQRGRAE